MLTERVPHRQVVLPLGFFSTWRGLGCPSYDAGPYTMFRHQCWPPHVIFSVQTWWGSTSILNINLQLQSYFQNRKSLIFRQKSNIFSTILSTVQTMKGMKNCSISKTTMIFFFSCCKLLQLWVLSKHGSKGNGLWQQPDVVFLSNSS